MVVYRHLHNNGMCHVLGRRVCLPGLEAGEVGLVLTYAVTLIGNFQWTVRQSAEVENMVRTCARQSLSTSEARSPARDAQQ